MGPGSARPDSSAILHTCAAIMLGVAALVCPRVDGQPLIIARAASVSGHVTLTSADGTPAFTLTRGYSLGPGDRIDTRGGGRVVIDLSDGSIVVVHPESVIEIKDFRAASSLRELFEITLGQVKVRINHFAGRPNPYRMNSPTASIAVRGTEFTIAVDASGDTEVNVQEGVVEVTSLSDPSHKVLIEAGRGVLVQAGQDFHLLSAPVARGFGEHDHDDQDSRHQGGDKGALQASQHGATGPAADPDAFSPRSTPGTYDRYIASLSQIGEIPFLYRYNAFPERYLDSLENPAYATGFQTPEARFFLLPTFTGVRGLRESAAGFGPEDTQPGNYSISPQFSMFMPVLGTRFVVGASFATSRLAAGADTLAPDFDPGILGGSPNLRRLTGSSTSSFYSSTIMSAARFGKDGGTSIGFSMDSLRGSGSLLSSNAESDAMRQASTEIINAQSNISQTRLTLGLTHNLGGTMKLGAYYRYGLIEATDGDRLHTVNGAPVGLDSTNSSGHLSDVGFRLRGMLTPRLSYGAAATWLGLTLGDGLIRSFAVPSQQRDRSQRGTAGIGIGYLLNRRVLLSADLAGGYSNVEATRVASATTSLLQSSGANSHFLSMSSAAQVDLTRKLFASASFMPVWQRYEMGTRLFPDQFGNLVPVLNPLFPVAGINPLVGKYFSDFGAGWRFSPQFFIQYLYSINYGRTSPSHTIMLEYTFRFRHE